MRRVEREHLQYLGEFFHNVPQTRVDHHGVSEATASADHAPPTTSDDPSALGDTLSPKLVEMKFPIATAQGPAEHSVFVPLVSLIPMNNLQVSALELEMDLELIEDDGELHVGFPQPRRSFFGREQIQPNSANAKLRVHVASGDRPAGLDIILQGYDRSVKAQVP